MFNLSITLLGGSFAAFSVPPSYWVVMPLVFFLAAAGSSLLGKPILLRMVVQGLQAGQHPNES
jgi:hypothetical protein